MIVDALCEAADHLEIRDKITDADAFLELDDTVLKQIEWYKGEDPRMLKAKDIVGRLRR